MAFKGFPLLPMKAREFHIAYRDIVNVVNSLRQGKVNSIGDVTLTLSATTTTVKSLYCSPDSIVMLMPQDANAASENWHIAPGDGQFIITHANAGTTRLFRYIVMG